MRRVTLLLAAVFLGCVTIDEQWIARATPEQVAAELHACNYSRKFEPWSPPGCELSGKMEAALVARKAARAKRLQACRELRAEMGMNKVEVIAAWGTPQDRNRSVFAWGEHEQWVYGSLSSAKYFYFDDDVLTSWQD
jgi:hypothetical protein